jgi:hypothetical protein
VRLETLRYEELNNLYASPNVMAIESRRMKWPGHVARMSDVRHAYRILVRKTEGKRPLGRRRHRWNVNIRTDLMEIGWKVVDWIHLAQDRDHWQALVCTVMKLRVP